MRLLQIWIFTGGLVLLLNQCSPTAKQAAPVKKGTLIHLDQVSSTYVDPRPIDVWLPPGYDSTRRYPVLYMHDGQMLFDGQRTWNHQEWKVDETMDSMVISKQVRPAIIVAIPNNGPYRWAEYVPQVILDSLPVSIKEEVIRKWLNNRPSADAYLKYIALELKPYIDHHFSTLSDRDHTYIMGSSMGGIISLYAICSYPDVFGGAACMSSHWPLDIPGTTEDDIAYDVPGFYIRYVANHLPAPDGHRIYFDYGTETLDSLYEPYQMRVDRLMTWRGYGDANWITRKFPGASHSEDSWAERLPIPLIFLLGQP